jgi:hypothetical protein
MRSAGSKPTPHHGCVPGKALIAGLLVITIAIYGCAGL